MTYVAFILVQNLGLSIHARKVILVVLFVSFKLRKFNKFLPSPTNIALNTLMILLFFGFNARVTHA